MRFAPSFCRAAGLALAWAVLCGACAHGAPVAAVPAAANGDNTPPKAMILTPEIETKLKEFVDKVKVEKEKVWTARMEKEIQAVIKTTGLDAERSKALEEPAKQAVDACLGDWAVKMSDQFRTNMAQMTADQASKYLDQITPQAAGLAQGEWLTNTATKPYEQADWIKALHQVLTPDQAVVWDKAQAAHKDEIEKEISGLLKTGAVRLHEQQTQEALAECDSIEQTLNLPKDRADKLEALAKSVVDLTAEMWRKRVEGMLIALPDEQLSMYTRNTNGGIYFGPDPTESPLQQAAWKNGLAGILTPDEVTRLQAGRDARKARRVHVMGQVMIMLLDEKIAFTEAQRQKFEPIADRLVKDVPQLYPENGENIYYQFPPDVFLTAAAKASDAEIKPILDDIQLKRWQQLSHPAGPDAAAADSSKDEIVEPEDVEKAISNFFYVKAGDEKKNSLDKTVLQAEDAVRVAGLSAEAALHLETAARGATEQYLLGWKWMMEQQIRSQMQDATPQNVKQRLENLQNSYFFQANPGTTVSSAIWDQAVKTEMNAQQQAAWKKETDARTAFHDKTVTSFILSEFDRKVQLSDDQSAKLAPLVTGLVRDYGPDISQMFSSGNNPPWYMSNQSSLLPFAGASDKDLKAILSPKQLALWTGSPECANSGIWWQNIQQIHKQRVRK